MKDAKNIPPEAWSYFAALPAYLQESIMQSGMKFQTREELMEFSKHIQER